MGIERGDSFDLHMLLRSGDLDIWGIAVTNVLAVEYFSWLSSFTNQAPLFTGTLARVAARADDINILQDLFDIKYILEKIGCKKFMPALTDIIRAEKYGDRKSAANFVKPILDDFNRFCMRIQNAKRSGKTAGNAESQGIYNPDYENSTPEYGTHPLKKVLELMDREEAIRKLRILAVDDTPVVLKIISSALGSEYKVFGMTDPKQVEPFLHQNTPELFLLDYKMPEISGFDLVPIIRSFKEHKTTPIIFLTSMGTSDHISTAISLGACDFIVKPFNADTLRQKVAKHIVRKVLS